MQLANHISTNHDQLTIYLCILLKFRLKALLLLYRPWALKSAPVELWLLFSVSSLFIRLFLFFLGTWDKLFQDANRILFRKLMSVAILFWAVSLELFLEAVLGLWLLQYVFVFSFTWHRYLFAYIKYIHDSSHDFLSLMHKHVCFILMHFI